MQRVKWFVLALMFFYAVPAIAKYEVLRVQHDGVIELNEGEKVKLAGIVMPEEAIKILPILLSKQKFDIREDKELSTGEIKSVYLYIDTSEVQRDKTFSDRNVSEKRMINELLIRLGSARVDRSRPFKYQAEFIELEEEAKRTGQGVWSYEESVASAVN